MSMKDVERSAARKQKPLSHTAEELGDNCSLFSTPSLPLPPKGSRQRTCHDPLLEKGGLATAVSTAVVESRALRNLWLLGMVVQRDLLWSARVEGQHLLGETGVCMTAISKATPASV